MLIYSDKNRGSINVPELGAQIVSCNTNSECCSNSEIEDDWMPVN